MIALQGPESRDILSGALERGRLPEPLRNELSVRHGGRRERARGPHRLHRRAALLRALRGRRGRRRLWDALVAGGATPAGLGARDTLRLEAGLPLYGFELGRDDDGAEIPIFAIPLAKLAVSFSPLKGDFIGRAALARQHDAFARVVARDYSRRADLPRLVQPIALAGRGVARTHAPVFLGERRVGYVTSGTSVPLLDRRRRGARLAPDRRARPALDRPGLPRLRRRRERRRDRRHPRDAGAGPGRPLPPAQRRAAVRAADRLRPRAARGRAAARRRAAPRRGCCCARPSPTPPGDRPQCMNLIPSEMTASPLVRLASVMDPAFRYAEHRQSEAFYDDELFYYQGTGFIAAVERRLEAELAAYLGCAETETRLDQRPDGQHGRVQRPRRLRQPRRPQGRAAAPRAWS